ncbi:MAG: CoA transferase [Burkholderiales bacterium]|nr:CoA transferase [Burkholderiales bacterium]
MLGGIAVLDATDRLGWLAGRVLADLGADVTKVEAPGADLVDAEWRALNVNKTLVELDFERTADGERFDALAAASDILLATPVPGAAAARLCDYARLAPRCPRLVVVTITPFGLMGPKSGWQASDIELMAAGGAMSLAGEPGKTPLRVSAPQAYAWTGAQAAIGALVALHHRAASGRGQQVDVSAQAAVITALSHAPAFVSVQGQTPTRAGAYMTGRSVTGARFRVFWPCRDGYINFILYGGVAGRRTNEQLVAWMRASGAELGALASIDWEKWSPTGVTQEEVDDIEAPIARFLAGIGKREFLDEGHRREMLGYPVADVADTASDAQLAARGFWQDIAGPDGRIERHCGCFAIVDGKRAALRAGGTPAAPVGQVKRT